MLSFCSVYFLFSFLLLSGSASFTGQVVRYASGEAPVPPIHPGTKPPCHPVPAGPYASFLLAHPLLQTTLSPSPILPWLFHPHCKKLAFFCWKRKYFISNLALLPPGVILARITRIRLYLIGPAYCRQVFNIAELAISYTPQNVRLLFKPATRWGPWSGRGA